MQTILTALGDNTLGITDLKEQVHLRHRALEGGVHQRICSAPYPVGGRIQS